MRNLYTVIVFLIAFAALSACVVRRGPGYRSQPSRGGKVCPPAHHWNGYACVHNGNKGGNGRGKNK